MQADVPLGNEYCDMAKEVNLHDCIEEDGGAADVDFAISVAAKAVSVATVLVVDSGSFCSPEEAPDSNSSSAVSASSFVIFRKKPKGVAFHTVSMS